jgi:ribonuclease HI
MANAKKYYVVWKGRRPGVYLSWEECARQVNGFPLAAYKAFSSLAEARYAFAHPGAARATGPATAARRIAPASGAPVREAIAVDASCIGNPGPMEYRGVEIGGGGRTVFRQGPLANGTNNVGEFLAIVEALEYLRQHGRVWPVYSDSQNAINWVRRGQCRTKLARTAKTASVFARIDRAEALLREHRYSNRIVKWKTAEWGEIPAYYGRK